MKKPLSHAQHIERFWHRVKKAGPDECWVWTGGRFDSGYGHSNKKGLGEARAHRAAWTLVRGAIPPGLIVCHECDNPICCNPEHLFLGTFDSNNKDKAEKGRCNPPMGEAQSNSKLTTEQVLAMRKKYRKGEYGCWKLAAEYNIRPASVMKIINRQLWKHI